MGGWWKESELWRWLITFSSRVNEESLICVKARCSQTLYVGVIKDSPLMIAFDGMFSILR